MSKLPSVLLAALCCSATAFAQPPAAEKAAAASSAITQFVASTASVGTTPFVTVLSTSIKPPAADNDLFIRFAAQTLLVTTSANNDTPAVAATFTAESVAIQVRALLDGVPLPVASPSPATIVTLDNLIRSTSRFTPLQTDFLALLIDEGGARTFNWIAKNIDPAAVHTVAIQARFLFSNTRFPLVNTSSSIAAFLGAKTLTVDAVNIKTD